MADEPDAGNDEQAASVAAQIAAVAEGVVADANAALAQGDEVNRALIAAQLGSVHAQRIEALERARETDSTELRAENRALAERLLACEAELKTALAAVTALSSKMETLSTPVPLVVNQNDVEVGQKVNPESPMEPPPPPPPPPPEKKLRHLI